MKRMVALVLLLVLSLTLCACGTEDTSAQGLILTTGEETGNYYHFGSLLAKKISSTTSTFVVAVASEGSRENILALTGDQAQFALTQYDMMIYASQGSGTFSEQGARTGFSVVAALYPEAVHIVTLNPDITSVIDLAGKRVSIGAEGSGVNPIAMDVLGAYGLGEEDIVASRQSFSESMEALLDGSLDAAFLVAGAPVRAVTALAEERRIFLVGMDEARIKALTASNEAYSRTVIPAEIYGTPTDCSTLAIDAVVVANNSVPSDEVYDFVRGIYGNIPALERESRFADYLSLELAASVRAVPYHPGAARYYAEQGISVPAA